LEFDILNVNESYNSYLYWSLKKRKVIESLENERILILFYIKIRRNPEKKMLK